MDNTVVHFFKQDFKKKKRFSHTTHAVLQICHLSGNCSDGLNKGNTHHQRTAYLSKFKYIYVLYINYTIVLIVRNVG